MMWALKFWLGKKIFKNLLQMGFNVEFKQSIDFKLQKSLRDLYKRALNLVHKEVEHKA